MSRYLISSTALLAAAYAIQPSSAQPNQSADWSSPWQAQAVPAQPLPQTVAAPSPAPVGYVLAQGVTFVPQAFTEIGFDSNPGQTFYDQKGSGFSRSGAAFSFNSVTERTAGNLSAAGSFLNYFNDTIFDDSFRVAGSARGNVTYLVQPGVTFTAGGFFNYDGESINRNQAGGATTELGYRDELFTSFVRARFSDVEYLNSFGKEPVSPLYLTSAFNYDRSEITAVGLLGNAWRVSPYAETSAARVDYTDQPTPALINRSADDYYGKGGLRVRLSPELTADVGWRWNERNTDDSLVRSYTSNFFDGNLTWRPSPFFFFTGSVERFIGEPSTSFAILSDVRSYNVKATYLPVVGVTVSLAGGRQVVTELGNGTHYHSNYADALVGWDYNNHVQFYTSLHYQNYQLDWQNLEYNEVRTMAGVRIIPDGQDLLNGESLESLFARLEDSRGPSNSELEVSAGYSWFGLPDMKMVTVVGGSFFDKALGQVTNGDGSTDGWRTDVRLGNFAQAVTPEGYLLSFGFSGFFANYQNTTKSHCMYSQTTDCAIVNIFDFDATQANNTGPGGDLNVSTDRNVNYYGVAVDFRPGTWAAEGFKDGPPVQELSPIKVGVAMRGLDETAKLTSIDPLVSDPVKYKETLNTHYYGGYIGVDRKQPLGDGWALNFDATAGIYYTDTQYQGRYSGYTPYVGGGTVTFVQDFGAVNASQDKGSFIGTMRVGLDRELGWGKVGLFGQGEYLSYVPRVAYNNNDQAMPLSWPIAGTQVGTRLKSDDAFNYTTGLSLSFRTN